MTKIWHPIHSYFKFRLASKNQHGVHSPFVYDFVTKCLYDKSKHSEYSKLKAFRQNLLNTSDKLTITDLGSGSHLMHTKQRSVSNIARHSGTTLKKAKLLLRTINYFKSNSILELGTSLGIGTHALSLGNPGSKIITIEGCPNVSNFTKKNFEKYDTTINLINSEFSDALSELIPQYFDLIFFDGNHQKEATLNYFESLLPTIQNNSVWIFDDIYWSKDMTEAWELIKQHPKVSVTVDIFHFGFVFFRQEQAKEHFKIRF